MQRTLDPVSRYGRSGSILLLNPTDRAIGAYLVDYPADDTPLTARLARDPRVIRGQTPVLPVVEPGVGFDPGEHTIAEVQAYVVDHPDQLHEVYDAERAGKNRATLVAWLETLIAEDR